MLGSVALLAALPFQAWGEERRDRLAWGLYEIYWGFERHRVRWEQTVASLGAQPDYVLFFRDLVRPFPAEAVRYHDAKGTRVILSLELEVWGARGPGDAVLEAIAAGKFDAPLRRFAQGAAETGLPVILRFGFEMNGDWFPWGGQPEAFKRAWRHAHALVSAHDGGRVQWMFSPNVLWDDRTFESDYAPYYPGDAYVDWVGLDGYNFGDNYDQYHRWQSFTEIFGPSITAIGRFEKPLILSEVGCAEDPRKPTWLREMFAGLREFPSVEAFVYFNYDKRSEGEPDWSLDSSPAALRAFRENLPRVRVYHHMPRSVAGAGG
ncbi:MAG: glycoside hydrolase family 26 protein [Opitutales bacterium]